MRHDRLFRQQTSGQFHINLTFALWLVDLIDCSFSFLDKITSKVEGACFTANYPWFHNDCRFFLFCMHQNEATKIWYFVINIFFLTFDKAGKKILNSRSNRLHNSSVFFALSAFVVISFLVYSIVIGVTEFSRVGDCPEFSF